MARRRTGPAPVIRSIITAFLAIILAAPAATAEETPVGTAPKAVSLSVADADVRDVVQALAAEFDANVTLPPDLAGQVTVHLKDVALPQALNAVLEPLGYGWDIRDSVIYVRKNVPEPPKAKDNIELLDNGNVTIRAQSVDLAALMTDLSAKTGLSIAVEQGSSAKVTADLVDVEPAVAVETLAKMSGLAVSKRNDIYQIFKPESPAGPKTSFEVVYEDDKVSLDVAKGDLGAVINAIVQKSGKDFIIYGAIRDQIDVKFDTVPLEEAMRTLLQGTRYTFRKLPNGIYMIGDKTQSAPTSPALTGTAVIPILNLKAEEVVQMMPPSVPTAGIKVLKEQNALSVKGSADEVEAVREYVASIDKEPPVIEVKVMVVEFSEDVSLNVDLSSKLLGPATPNSLDVSPGKVSADLNLRKIDLNERFTATLNALIGDGRAKVHVSPKVSTLSGHEATINVTREEFFKVTTGNVETPLTQLEKITSGIILTITPWASLNSDRVWVKMAAEVSSPTGVSAEGLPAISARKANTEVILENGKTLVMGGLFQTRETNSEDRFPFLGKVPVLGYFFKKEQKSQSKSELVFYITPTLVDTSVAAEPPNPSIKQ